MMAHIYGDLAAKDQNWDTLDVVRAIAAERDVSPSQVSLSWLTNRPGVVAPILGAKTVDQLEQNIVGGDLLLDDDETARLDNVSAPTSTTTPMARSG